MIERPPKDTEMAGYEAAEIIFRDDMSEIIAKCEDDYSYWTDVRYKKLPDGISNTALWRAIKSYRSMRSMRIWSRYDIHFTMTNAMQRKCHWFDMNFGGSWASDSIVPDKDKRTYLISTLMEEAISSSQMEGASTTRKIAKDMLRNKKAPNTKSEQMILNNYNTIQYIAEHKDEPLSRELLLEIHARMTNETLDNKEDEGRFRTNDNIVVQNGITGEVVHTPPPHDDIDYFVEELCYFFNNEGGRLFIHPIIKGIIIHFVIAYVHPFVDGNGRTARALFYWYMLKNGYWLTQFLSISRIIYRTKAKYEKVYMQVESDGMDIGYFVKYNLDVLSKAFDELKLYISSKQNERKASSAAINIGLNERQSAIIGMYAKDNNLVLSIKDICGRLNISHPTAKSDVNELVQKGLLIQKRVNKVKSVYIIGNKLSY